MDASICVTTPNSLSSPVPVVTQNWAAEAADRLSTSMSFYKTEIAILGGN
jgi:hypothetical protein